MRTTKELYQAMAKVMDKAQKLDHNNPNDKEKYRRCMQEVKHLSQLIRKSCQIEKKELKKRSSIITDHDKIKKKSSKIQVEPQKPDPREELITELYNTAKRKCGYGFGLFGGGRQWYQISPKQLKMDNGDTIQVEYVQPSYFDNNVLINYQTDNLRSTQMSLNELRQLANII